MGRERRWCIRRDDRDQHARTASTDHFGGDDRHDRRQPRAPAERRPQTSGHRRGRRHRLARSDLCRWPAPADTRAERRRRVHIPFRSACCRVRRTGSRRLRIHRAGRSTSPGHVYATGQPARTHQTHSERDRASGRTGHADRSGPTPRFGRTGRSGRTGCGANVGATAVGGTGDVLARTAGAQRPHALPRRDGSSTANANRNIDPRDSPADTDRRADANGNVAPPHLAAAAHAPGTSVRAHTSRDRCCRNGRVRPG